MAKKMLVLGEVRENSLRNVSFESLAAAKMVAAGRRSNWCINWRIRPCFRE